MNQNQLNNATEPRSVDQQACSLSFADFAKIWNDAGNLPFSASPELAAWLRSLPSNEQGLRDYLTANAQAVPNGERAAPPTR